MENPLVFRQQDQASSSFNAAYLNSGNPMPETSCSGMMHNPGISLEWTAQEQATLADGLKKYASEPSVICYAKIALNLPNKTVRDVALRSRWMTTKEASKRRKEEHNLPRKSKDKRERLALPSAQPNHFAAQPNLSPNSLPMIPMDNDDEYRVFGGAVAELLQQNRQALKQINANLSSFKIQENIVLFCQTRENILKLLNYAYSMPVPDTMKTKMPGIDVKLNDELASTILPLSFQPPMQCNHDPASNAILPLSLHPMQCSQDPASNAILPLSLHPMQCSQDPAFNPSSLLVSFP